MKLTEILNDITPLPWRKRPVMAEVLVSSETLANQAYVLHAANVLPELLAAAKNLRDNWEHNLTEPMARLNRAIERAEDISEQ
jgi:hypothetical protein